MNDYVLNYCRMLQRRDEAENWKESNSIPEAGEIIVYNKNTNNPVKIKVGDGETVHNLLKAITGEVYVQSQEPTDAGEGAIWFKIPESPAD